MGNKKYDSPCKDCLDRHTACHDTCEAYQTWRTRKHEVERRSDKEYINYIHDLRLPKLYHAKPTNKKPM